MRNITSRGPFPAIRGLQSSAEFVIKQSTRNMAYPILFLFLLTSANVFAESRDASMNVDPHAGNSGGTMTVAEALQTAPKNLAQHSTSTQAAKAFKRQKSATTPRGHSRPVSTGRVHLDDYQRVPRAVTRPIRTEPLWIGRNKDKGRR